MTASASQTAAITDKAGLIHHSMRNEKNWRWEGWIFLTRWQELMCAGKGDERQEDDPTWLQRILVELWDDPTQRDATVAASFVEWLGTGIGRCLLLEAKRLFGILDKGDAYVAAWTIHNRRRIGRNSGIRSIEWTLAPPDTERDLHGNLRQLPDLAVRDFEVVECVAAWLGTPNGQMFLSICEREIEAVTRHQQDFHSADVKAGRPQRELTGEEIRRFILTMRDAMNFGVKTRDFPLRPDRL